MILTSTKAQEGLPRYFAAVFELASKINRGQLDFELPDGRVFRAQGAHTGPIAHLKIHHPDTFSRLMREGELGFSESYMDGDWSTPDLQAFMDLLRADNDVLFDGFPGAGLVRYYERMRHWMNRNTVGQAKKNISYHYDLGNAFYALWLDDTMTYSSALFAPDQHDLKIAQLAKYQSIIEHLGVKRGDHILEIGCGWGGFAHYAAGTCGVNVTGLTISQEQLIFARQRIDKNGLTDSVNFKLQDYRDEETQYDGIVSIEMFEAVGEKYWPVYFDTIHRCLKPTAKATLQIITVHEDRFAQYRKGVDFIQKFIFPGGMLPSPSALKTQIQNADLQVEHIHDFGESYSKTLRDWYTRFNARWPDVKALGFDERFQRMWNFYLTSCAAAFHSGNCDVSQITISRSH
nr:cyclopropane-fatty-acyl-phospholipid synthase family protein [uncultured Shimia sp.]